MTAAHSLQRNDLCLVLFPAACLVCTPKGGWYNPRRPNQVMAALSASQDASYSTRGYATKYSGHRNTHPGRNAAWMGSRSEYVVSGSDDGSLFVWDADTAEVLNIVRGGSKAIRRVQVGGCGDLMV